MRLSWCFRPAFVPEVLTACPSCWVFLCFSALAIPYYLELEPKNVPCHCIQPVQICCFMKFCNFPNNKWRLDGHPWHELGCELSYLLTFVLHTLILFPDTEDRGKDRGSLRHQRAAGTEWGAHSPSHPSPGQRKAAALPREPAQSPEGTRRMGGISPPPPRTEDSDLQYLKSLNMVDSFK